MKTFKTWKWTVWTDRLRRPLSRFTRGLYLIKNKCSFSWNYCLYFHYIFINLNKIHSYNYLIAFNVVCIFTFFSSLNNASTISTGLIYTWIVPNKKLNPLYLQMLHTNLTLFCWSHKFCKQANWCTKLHLCYCWWFFLQVKIKMLSSNFDAHQEVMFNLHSK